MTSPDAAAAAVSIAKLRPAEAALVLPAMSVCLAVSVWLPLVSTELVIDQLPEASATALPKIGRALLRERVKISAASVSLQINTGVVLLVRLSVLDIPVS